MTFPHLELIPAAPPLADERSPSYDQRLESLLQAQQELMNLIVGGFGVRNILDCLVPVIEEIFAPAACGIALLKRQDGRFTHRAATRLPAELADQRRCTRSPVQSRGCRRAQRRARDRHRFRQ